MTSTLDFSDEEFIAMSLGGAPVDLVVDDFVEVGYYAGRRDTAVRVARFERRPLDDPRLLRIFPPPDRYLDPA